MSVIDQPILITGAAGFMKPTVSSSNKDSKKKPIDKLLEIEAKTVK